MADRKKELEKSKKAGEDIIKNKVDEKSKELEEMAPKANKIAQTNEAAKKSKPDSDVPSPEEVAEKGYVEKQPTKEEKTVKPETETKTEENIEVPKELENKLFESDEGKVAQEAIDSGDASKLSDIVDENGQPVLQGQFNEEGKWIPYVKADVEDPRIFSRPQALALTLISCVLSTLTAGFFPPINFLTLDKQDWYLEKVQEVNQNYADVVNGTVKERNATRTGAEQKAMDYDLAQQMTDEGIQKTGRMNEASAGGTGLQQAQLNADLAKWAAEFGLEADIAKMNLSADIQKNLATLMNDLEVTKLVNKIKAAKDAGLSGDELAQYVRAAEQGLTNAAARMKMGTDVVNAGTNLITNIVGAATSDKNVKKFDAKPVNNTLLKSAFKWR